MSDNENADQSVRIIAYVMIALAAVGLLMFIINWIRCRYSRDHLQEFEEDEELGQMKVAKGN
jgi:hypothetical protein